MSEKLKGASSLLAGAFAVSTFGIWTRYVAPMFSPAMQTTIRCLVAAGFMGLLFFAARRKKYKLRGYTRQEYFYMGLLGFLTTALALLFITSVMQTKVGNTSSLIYAGSIVTTFLAGTFFLGEKTSGLKITAVLVAVAGLCMYAPDLLSLSLGVLTGFAAGICDGSANIVRKQLRSVDRNVAVFYQYAVAGVLAAPFILFMGGSPIKEVGAIPIVALLIYTVVSLIFAKLLLHGFSHFDVNAGGVILAVQIFFGMLLGFLVFHEVPSMNELAGSILVFTAVLLAVWGSVRQTVNIGGKQQKPVAINEPT